MLGAAPSRRDCPHVRAAGEHGSVTAPFIAAAGLSLLVVTVIINLLVFTYARGAVRAALDEGVRQGARLGGDVAVCDARTREALGDLLGGTLGERVAFQGCALEQDRVVARSTGRVDGWLPLVGDLDLDLRARALVTSP